MESEGKGKKATSRPIRKKEDIERLRTLLRNKPRDLLMFDIATQTGLRLKDLVAIKVGDLSRYQIGERVTLHLHENDSKPSVLITERLYRSFRAYLATVSPDVDEYLFKSRKGGGPLTKTSVSRLVQSWYASAGLAGLSGWSSLRRTWKLHYAKDAPLFVSRRHRQGFLPVIKKTVQEAVYREMLKVISSGQLSPGQRIITDQIATDLKVSETPVREALARLQARGLIWRDDHKGYVVQQLSSDDLEEIIKIRVALETMAITEACKRISDAEIAGLMDMAKAFSHRDDADIDEFYRFNQRFHSTVYQAAQMPTLLGIIENLWEKMSPYFHLLFKEIEEDDPRVGWSKHVLIIDALKKRDAASVARYLQADITDYAYLIINKMREKRL
jgi:DNA-binding GntR family transcriptional regulator